MSINVAWVLYAIIGSSFISGFFLWAVRNRQFSDQDRARYLPLATLEETKEERQ